MEKMIFVNLKMYFNSKEEIKKYQIELEEYKTKFIVLPQNIYLDSFVKKGFIVGSQNVSDKEDGPYTGETSAKSLKDIGVKYTMIGHYEVRKNNVKENELIEDKVRQAIKNDLKVILCIGETKEEKEEGKTIEKIKNQLKYIKPDENIIISYEPAYSINSNIVPTSEELIEAIKLIKELGYKKVLYGGSVNTENIENLNKIDIIDGFLIGSNALNSSNLIKMIEVVA